MKILQYMMLSGYGRLIRHGEVDLWGRMKRHGANKTEMALNNKRRYVYITMVPTRLSASK